GTSNAHVLRNCPIDEEIPVLTGADPVADKRAKKKTFVGEAFLALVAALSRTPLMAYSSRNDGDFFTDVVAIDKYHGMQTGFSDSELVYHNDRTAHWARADYIALLGLRCPEQEFIYTSYVDGARLLEHLSAEHEAVLRRPHFVTSFDVYSRDTNRRQSVSDPHAIFEGHHDVRYLDTFTRVNPGAPEAAKDALLALRDALVLAGKQRHRLRTGDLLLFANQAGLHSRDKMEINDAERARTRWLLKTYTFADDAAADRFADRWHGGVRGLISD
ncbi:taurine catabolism dioxygenase TauD, partial [Micromonospora fluostatini]